MGMQSAKHLPSTQRAMEAGKTAEAAGRRAVIGGMLASGSLLNGPAKAYLPDDNDKALIEKAKAQRKATLQAERDRERAFATQGGTKVTQALDIELAPIQKAVIQLSKTGSALEKKDVKGAATNIEDGWVNDLQNAMKKVSTTDQARA